MKAVLRLTFYDRNEDEKYEKIGDCLYEQIDNKPVQEQGNTLVVGGNVDADEATTSL